MLTGFRDTELIVMNELNDRDLLSYCQTDKIGVCKNEDFWRNRFIKVHGEEAAKFKNKDRSWKDYYLAVIYYREKYTNARAVEEAAKRDYMDLFLFFSQFVIYNKMTAVIASENRKYVELIKNMNMTQHIATMGLLYAAKIDDRELINFFLDRGGDPNFIPLGILRGKNKQLIDNVKDEVDPNQGLIFSIEGRNPELIKYFIDKGANDWDNALSEAIRIGDIKLINFFITKGAKRWNSALRDAAETGKRELVDFFVDKGARNFSGALAAAETGGYKDMIKYIKELKEKYEKEI